MIERIKIPQVSLPPREILIKDRGQEIILFDSCLWFHSSGTWNFENEKTGLMEEKFFDNTYTYDRVAVWAIEMYYYNETRQYILSFAEIKIAFGGEDEHPKYARLRCLDLFNKIIKWKYGIES